MKVLITGGAGFIGSHLADELLAHGYEVRVLDNLEPQVHGAGRRTPPDYLNPEAEFVHADVRDPDRVRPALEGVGAVFHLAAAVGVGQSMYEVDRYTSVNSLGTAVLLKALIDRPVSRLVVASSMSIYGEGLYRRLDGSEVPGRARPRERLEAGEWELMDEDGWPLEPVPTPEEKPPDIASIYALTKYDQERTVLLLGRAYRFPVTALRFFNAYGTRQALSNPYTGVLAIFASRLLNGRGPLLFEDGYQQRDFVSVRDVVRACRLALESPRVDGEVINVGSGRPVTVRELALRAARVMGRPELGPIVSGEYRVGDIRHCFADIDKARRLLGYEPRIDLTSGLQELTEWLATQSAADGLEAANRELARRGLRIRGSREGKRLWAERDARPY